MSKAPRVRPKDDAATKEKYLIEAAAFAAAVAAELHEPEAEKLYCPAFKVKACGCIQRFITGGEGTFPSEGALRRAMELLQLHREASKLKSKISTTRQDKGDKRVLRMLRAEGFERFVLANRLLVRHEMGICERACQRLLYYSNNFLHKDLKTGPEKGPRIKRLGGKKPSRHALRAISDIARETCCSNRCVRLVQTHTRHIENWRKASQNSQQSVRKVVGEMLVPKIPGLPPTCHKFISFVTGCSFSVISRVKEQHRKNKGFLPEVKHSWKDKNPTKSVINHVGQNGVITGNTSTSGAGLDPMLPNVGEVHGNNISSQEIQLLNGSAHVEHRHHTELNSQQQELQYEQPTISHFIQTISAVSPTQVLNSVPANGDSPPQSHTLTVLGPAATTSPGAYHSHLTFLEPPSHHSPVIISLQEAAALQGCHPISVIASPTSDSASPFSNVVILPESAIFLPTPTIAPAEHGEFSGQITVGNNMDL